MQWVRAIGPISFAARPMPCGDSSSSLMGGYPVRVGIRMPIDTPH